jgi:hypothetical protein
VATILTMAGTLPAGVTFTNNADGTATLAGTPAVSTGGPYPIIFTASNGITSANQAFTLSVQQGAAITSANSTTFPQAVVGTFRVTSTGYPVAGLVITGALPSGVTFTDNGDGTGTLAGSPAAGQGGSYPVTITATNGIGSPATQSFTLNVSAPPAFSSASSTTLMVGAAGSFSVTTTGGPVAASIALSGALPSGLTFVDNGNGTGTLAGVPGAGTGGTHSITLTAANGVGSPATQNFALTVNQASAITSASVASFEIGVVGSFSVTTSGFPVSSLNSTGALPSGVTFTDNGNGTATLAGTPAAATNGTYLLTMTAGNGVGTLATQDFTLTVQPCTTVTVSPQPDALPVGTYGSGYAQIFTAVGGSGHTFAISSGSLPAGLTLAGAGELAGSPTTTGAFTFTVTATSSSGCTGSSVYRLVVAPDAQSGTSRTALATRSTRGRRTPSTPAVVVSGSILSNDAGRRRWPRACQHRHD